MKKYKVVTVLYVQDSKNIEALLNTGWTINRVDTTRDLFIYILEKEV